MDQNLKRAESTDAVFAHGFYHFDLGICTLLALAFFLPLGIVASRYLKTHTHLKMLWIKLHVVMVIAAACCILLGLYFIIFTSGRKFTVDSGHGLFGYCLLLCIIVQVVIGAIKARLNKDIKGLINLHKIMGWCIAFAGFISIISGLTHSTDNYDRKRWETLLQLSIGFTVFNIVIFAPLEMLKRRKNNILSSSGTIEPNLEKDRRLNLQNTNSGTNTPTGYRPKGPPKIKDVISKDALNLRSNSLVHSNSSDVLSRMKDDENISKLAKSESLSNINLPR
jgi:hypothetical protein